MKRTSRVPLEDGWAVAHTFESAGWAVELIEHGKGHMIPVEHHDASRNGSRPFLEVAVGFVKTTDEQGLFIPRSNTTGTVRWPVACTTAFRNRRDGQNCIQHN